MNRLITGLLLTALAMGTVQAQMCKWVAEDGSVHYAERCPEGKDSQKVDLSAAGPSGGDDPYASSGAGTNSRGKAKGQQTAANNKGGQANYKSMSSSQLKSQCEKDRQARLKPERERLIKDCRTKGEMDAAQCGRYYATYGDGGRQGGRTVQRKYDNLPSCVAARGAGP